MDRDFILKNVSDIPAEKLFDSIKEGLVTLDELKDTQQLDARKRKEIVDLEKKYLEKDQKAWEIAEFGTETSLREYIRNFPTGKFIENAKTAVRRIQDAEDEKRRKKERILNAIKENPNTYASIQINTFLNNGTITRDDLLDCNIPKGIIDLLDKTDSIDFNVGKTPNAIPEGFTEVYFWGIPGSGKTCALSAVLSTADAMGNLEFTIGPGFDYMTKLKNIYTDDYATLPPATPVDATQYLPFSLRDNRNRNRSISLIELSGEIFECFYKKNSGQELDTTFHEDTFFSLLKFLNSDNRKLHFFFIDYDQQNKKDTKGYTQSDYLNAAATYFKANNIFRKTTDAIYIVLTKSDLMPYLKSEWEEKAIEYFKENKFTGFINTLKDVCRKNSINGGRLTVEPFSLGDIYFQKYCDFDDTSAKRILNIFNQRIKSDGKGILNVFNK